MFVTYGIGYTPVLRKQLYARPTNNGVPMYFTCLLVLQYSILYFFPLLAVLVSFHNNYFLFSSDEG
jgi:hypothetical protein